MSRSMHVLFDGKLPDEAALTQCFRELGFPLAFEPGADLLAPHPHYLAMRLRGEETGFELGISDGREDVERIAGEEINPRFTRYVRASSAGGDEADAAASCFAAALARLVDGRVLRSHSDAELTPDRAIALARRDLNATAERFSRPGTRPAEIRRYLASLLQQRRDLVLVGRRLLIRPVRHLLRGALLDTTGDRFELCVGPYIMPLYDGSRDSIGYVGHLYHDKYKVWRSNFVPLLIDALGEEFFKPLGTMTTTYLVEGSISRRTARVLLEGVECPSLSPDETKIAFKHLVGQGDESPCRRHDDEHRADKHVPVPAEPGERVIDRPNANLHAARGYAGR